MSIPNNYKNKNKEWKRRENKIYIKEKLKIAHLNQLLTKDITEKRKKSHSLKKCEVHKKSVNEYKRVNKVMRNPKISVNIKRMD